MAHRTARPCAALVAALMIALPAPALAHGGDTAASPSPVSMDGHGGTGHDMAGMEGHDMGAMDEGEGDTSHEHGARTGQGDHTQHEQTEDTISPQMRTLVLTGFGSINGAVVVAAFLIRRQRPPRQTGARR